MTSSFASSSPDPGAYMQYGAGRRLAMIVKAYRGVIFTVYDGRVDPLTHEEEQTLSRDINLIYINLRGVLDNLAACLLHETQPELEIAPGRQGIDLFSGKYRKKLRAFATIASSIAQHDEWYKDVKERRDPVAHRIPLYLPPAFQTPTEAERYSELLRTHARELNALQLGKAKATFERMNHIGKFYPYFLHHPDSAPIRLYPTIPDDVAHLIRISRAVEAALLASDIG